MRCKQAINFFWIAIVALFPFLGWAQEYPPRPSPPKLVNDFSGTLSEQQTAALEQKLVAYDDSTSTQIAIVILKSLGGYPIEDYTFELGTRWGIGRDKKDNGILILVAMEDRKTFIATGYGMEGTITDARAKNIIENAIKPNFREEKYFEGLQEATDRIIAYAKGEYVNEDGPEESIPWKQILGIFLLIVFFMLFKAMQVKRYAFINNLPFWTAWILLNQSSTPHRGSWGGFSGRGGSSGGGFGGFGGGSFGGGGAGGSW